MFTISKLAQRSIILFIIIISYFLFLGYNGTLTSGFHFIDDHEVIQMNKDLVLFGGSLLEVIKKWLTGDMIGRFRPLWVIHNVLTYTLFKGNFFNLAVFHAIEISFITFFLFFILNKNGYSVMESLVFAFLSMTGSQSTIWWRLGQNETISMFFLSLTLIFVTYSVKSKKHKILYRILYCVFAIATMLCKESFLILMPSLFLLILGLDFKNHSNKKTLRKIFYNRLPELIFLSICFISFILYILKKIQTGYFIGSGENGASFHIYYKGFKDLFFHLGFGITSFILFLISFILHMIKLKGQRKKFIFSHCFILILCILITFPQVFLYAKSGIYGRYFLPGMLAWSLMFAFSIHNINTLFNDKIREKAAFYSARVIECIVVSAFFFILICRVSKKAKEFTIRGNEVNTVLSFIQENTNSNSTILFIADPPTDFERTISFRRYLYGLSDISTIYTYPVIPETTNNLGKILIHDFSWVMGGMNMCFDSIPDKNKIDLIVLFPKLGREINAFKLTGLNASEYYEIDIGEYKIYYNKKEKVYFTEKYHLNSIAKQEGKDFKQDNVLPNIKITKGSEININIIPEKAIKENMNAYIILLDAEHPKNIYILKKISGAGKINIQTTLNGNIEKPWLMYRNLGTETLPAVDLIMSVKKTPMIFIPVR